MKVSNKIEGGNGHAIATVEDEASRKEADATSDGNRRLTRRVTADAVTIEFGAAGFVAAERAELRNALAGVVFSSHDAAIERGVARQVVTGGSVQLTKAGAGTLVAAGDANVTKSGAGALLALGHMDINQAGGCGLVAGSATVARGGIVGVAITPRLVVSEGGRVLFPPGGALGVIAGAGIVLLINWLLGLRRSRTPSIATLPSRLALGAQAGSIRRRIAALATR